jgi:dTDP-4-amino-4,6-dideoxygalactose transaminase
MQAVAAVLQTGRLHRYNVDDGEESEAARLEREYAAWQGTDYCLACTSGGYALQLALRAAGLQAGDTVLANAWTLAPVPGAIYASGGQPVFVEIDSTCRIDLTDLAAKADASGAKFLMLSHMRGHIADMEAIQAICESRGIVMIEDCAHTMGARWNAVLSGNFGHIACFSTQTYKHMNSGEGGLLTTNDPEIAARATILSGSYMLYDRHGAGPDTQAFEDVRLTTPNCSGRMDNMRAALLRAQLPDLPGKIDAWNRRYAILEAAITRTQGLAPIPRPTSEAYVGSSIQFQAISLQPAQIPDLLARLAARGVEVKWFGEADPRGFTSRYDSWRYLADIAPLPNTLDALSKLLDMRIPLTFDEADCTLIGTIIGEEAAKTL